MRKTIISIIVVIVSFTIGYWTRTIVDIGNFLTPGELVTSVKPDSIIHDELLIPKVESPSVPSDGKPEGFDDFIIQFSRDSLFQLNRVKFPMGSVKKSEWKMETLFGRDDHRPQVYDNFNGDLRDTDERLLRKLGLGNGIWVEYRFSRIEGFWYLTSLTDFSD